MAAPDEILSLEEIKRDLRVTHDSDDESLKIYRNDGLRYIENYIGVKVADETIFYRPLIPKTTDSPVTIKVNYARSIESWGIYNTYTSDPEFPPELAVKRPLKLENGDPGPPAIITQFGIIDRGKRYPKIYPPQDGWILPCEDDEIVVVNVSAGIHKDKVSPTIKGALLKYVRSCYEAAVEGRSELYAQQALKSQLAGEINY